MMNDFVITPILAKLMGQAKNMRLIECHKFNELNTALPNIWAEQSACTSPDSDYEVDFSVPEYCDCVVIFTEQVMVYNIEPMRIIHKNYTNSKYQT